MIYLYDILALAALVVISPYYLWRMTTTDKYRAGLRQRLGFFPKDVRDRLSSGNWIWVHAVSLGETNAVRPLMAELKRRLPDHAILVSTVTDTGQARARELPEVDQAIYLPLDIGIFLSRLLRFFRPKVLIIAETELWPRLIVSADRRGIPVCLVNGRISDRSFPRYNRFRTFTTAVFRRMSLIGMQTEEDARRVRALGAPERVVDVSGNLKFDSVRVEPVSEEDRAGLRREWGLADGERLILGGSTWPGEEEVLVDAYESLRASFPDLRLLLAPRHIERMDEVVELLRSRDLPFSSRTGNLDGTTGEDIPDVLLLDTTGELARTYAIAEIAFVGKSLTERGGQNPLEPAGQGVAVLFGPNMQNFRGIAPRMVDEEAALRVDRVEELGPALGKLLADPETVRLMGKRARDFVGENAGAAERTAERILSVMGNSL